MAKVHFFLFVILGTLSHTLCAYAGGPIRPTGEENGPSKNSSLILGEGNATKTGLALMQNETQLPYLVGYLPALEVMNNFGTIPYSKWNIDVVSEEPECNILMYWQTNSSNCTDIKSCRGILKEISQVQINNKGYVTDNFHILPDGSILEGLGWDEIHDNSYRVNLFTENERTYPSYDTLRALNYLVQVAVSLKKLSTDFAFSWPSHTSRSLDDYVKIWAKMGKISFDQDDSLSRISIQDLKVISRTQWKAMTPIREFEGAKGQAEVVAVTITASACLTHENCSQFVRDMQQKQILTHSDIFPNFLIGSDGRIYEGLGWNWSRKEKVVFFGILAECEGCVPWTHALAAFTLQLREGVDLGWISENYSINITSAASETASAKITKWGEWARHIVKENFTAYLQTAGGDDSLITRIDTGDVAGKRGVTSLEYPAGRIYFTQSDAGCSKPTHCLPFKKRLGRKCLSSQKEVTSNFYFVDDGADFQVVHVGLGWNLTTKENTVVFEFLTPNVNTLPSTRSMIQSVFLVREGLRKGIFTPDYRITVAKHTSIAFENLVRFWDKKLRTSSII